MEKRKRGRPKKDVIKDVTFLMIMEQDLKESFQKHCLNLNISVSQRLRELMRQDIKNK